MMGRNKGTFNFASNFEVLTKAPLDARLVVDTKANLITPSVWQDIASQVWLYKGIVVSVVADPSTENNGLYFLTDETTYTSYSSWLKINGTVPSDPSGTSSATFQLHNGANGVVLKDVSGNLQVLTFDGSTFANIQAGSININSIRIDHLNGALYAQDGSVYSIAGGQQFLGYNGFIQGNGSTNVFTVVHDLSTFQQSITVWDRSNNEVIYADVVRGASTNYVSFIQAPSPGSNYDLVIVGFPE